MNTKLQAVHRLSDYESIVGKEQLNDLKSIASNIEKKSIKHINSTKAGGGVAEILFR